MPKNALFLLKNRKK